MAKQKTGKSQSPQQVKKPAPKQGEKGFFSYLWRNVLIALAFFAVYEMFWGMFSKERSLSKLTEQFYQLRAQNPQSPELRSLYDEIMQVQPDVIADTSYLTKLLRGYHWAINDLAFGNFENIEKVKEEMSRNQEDSTPQSTLDAKLRRRVGLYSLFEYINKTTPKDAVIYIPAGDSAMWNNPKWNFIFEPAWTEYFIYPRLCVIMGHEDLYPGLAQRATHVLILNGMGYEKLKYNVPPEQRVQEAVLPIDRPPVPSDQNVKP